MGCRPELPSTWWTDCAWIVDLVMASYGWIMDMKGASIIYRHNYNRREPASSIMTDIKSALIDSHNWYEWHNRLVWLSLCDGVIVIFGKYRDNGDREGCTYKHAYLTPSLSMTSSTLICAGSQFTLLLQGTHESGKDFKFTCLRMWSLLQLNMERGERGIWGRRSVWYRFVGLPEVPALEGM